MKTFGEKGGESHRRESLGVFDEDFEIESIVVVEGDPSEDFGFAPSDAIVFWIWLFAGSGFVGFAQIDEDLNAFGAVVNKAEVIDEFLDGFGVGHGVSLVDQGFSIGRPTLLPHSVQEPS